MIIFNRPKFQLTHFSQFKFETKRHYDLVQGLKIMTDTSALSPAN